MDACDHAQIEQESFVNLCLATRNMSPESRFPLIQTQRICLDKPGADPDDELREAVSESELDQIPAR